MVYIIKGFIENEDMHFEKSFEIKCPSFKDVVELLKRVSFEAYDRITILPEDYKEI